jgi:hypothetical protein
MRCATKTVLMIAVLILLWSALSRTVMATSPPEGHYPVAPVDSDPAAQASLNKTFGKRPLSFESNLGQTDFRVKFLCRGRGYALF